MKMQKVLSPAHQKEVDRRLGILRPLGELCSAEIRKNGRFPVTPEYERLSEEFRQVRVALKLRAYSDGKWRIVGWVD